jgi:hypothetical protein
MIIVRTIVFFDQKSMFQPCRISAEISAEFKTLQARFVDVTRVLYMMMMIGIDLVGLIQMH